VADSAVRTSYEASPAKNERILFSVSIAILFVGGIVLAAVLVSHG